MIEQSYSLNTNPFDIETNALATGDLLNPKKPKTLGEKLTTEIKYTKTLFPEQLVQDGTLIN